MFYCTNTGMTYCRVKYAKLTIKKTFSRFPWSKYNLDDLLVVVSMSSVVISVLSSVVSVVSSAVVAWPS